MDTVLKDVSAPIDNRSESLYEQINDLLWNIRSTSGSRFAAAKRLEKRDQSLTTLTAFTSAYIIILTVLPYILSTPQTLSDRVNLATVAMAVVVLVSSLLQYSSRDVVNAEQYHRSALELKELRREIKALSTQISADKFLEYSARYSRILEKYSVNHDDVDYLRFKLENHEHYKLSKWDVRYGRAKLSFTNSRPLISLAAITALCVALGYYALVQNPTLAAGSPPASVHTDLQQKL